MLSPAMIERLNEQINLEMFSSVGFREMKPAFYLKPDT
jgi:ferritin